MTRALLIGIDPYTVRACAELGLETLVVASAESVRSQPEWADSAPLRPLVVQSVESVEFVLSELYRHGVRAGSFDLALSSLESALVAAASVASALDAPFMDPAQALMFRDKALQKDAVSAAGIPTARYQIIDDINADEDAVRLPWPRAVLKPVAGMGTYSTRVVESPDRLPQAIRDVRASAILRTFMLEEFSQGSEWCLDGVLFEGELAVLSMGAYGAPCIDVAASGAALRVLKYPPDLEPKLYRLGEELALRVTRALGLSSGVFHLEAFFDPELDGFRFGEIAARRGGGLIQEAVHYESGVDLARANVQAALGIRPDPPARTRRPAGFTYIPCAPGTVTAMPRPEDFLQRPGVEYVRVDCPPGSRIGVADNTDTRAARVLVSGQSVGELDARMDDVVGWAADRVAVLPDGASYREIWRDAALRREFAFAGAAAPNLYTPR
jgi:biotin carboxylase